MRIFIEQTDRRTLPQWEQINWHHVEANVRRIQERIYRATEQQDWKKVRSLQKLLVRAMSNKLLAIRRVTQENQGKHTPGVDGRVYDTPEARTALSQEKLSLQGYQPRPVRRVYIPKADGKKMRPLGIPIVKDRVMQAIVKAALEPEWEARFEANSYGFRPGRSCMDALTQIHTALNQEGSSEWILDADIQGCFDNISHKPLLTRIPVFDTTIRRWLKAGVVELGHYTDTEAGTPQGGCISPLLANIALDGMERLFGCETPDGQPVPPTKRKGKDKGISLIRYADDFVAIAPTRKVLEEYVIPCLTQFLSERGLSLSEAKTHIVQRDEGFNFLGFTIRRFGHTLLTQPQKEKVQCHLRQVKEVLGNNKQAKVEYIVKMLNPVIRGWANYYRHSAAKATYNYIAHRYWQVLWQWAKRRHPNKPSKWVRQRYFKTRGNRTWVFGETTVTLLNPTDTPITRYVKVCGRNSPYDPTLRAYWAERTKRAVGRETYSRLRLQVLRAQDYRCGQCGILFQPGEDIDLHHRIPRKKDGTDTAENLIALHPYCHHQFHQRHGYKVLKA
jgi:RNA-directed DNA polymerase